MSRILEETRTILCDSKDDGKVMADLHKEGFEVMKIACGIWDKSGNVHTWIHAKKGKVNEDDFINL